MLYDEGDVAVTEQIRKFYFGMKNIDNSTRSAVTDVSTKPTDRVFLDPFTTKQGGTNLDGTNFFVACRCIQTLGL